MAELNQKLHVMKNGVTTEITCYTALDEVQNQGVPLKIGGVNCYARYGAVDDPFATVLNYKPPNGGTNSILYRAGVVNGNFMIRFNPDARVSYHSFTVPQGATFIHVVGVDFENELNEFPLVTYIKVTPGKTYSLRYAINARSCDLTNTKNTRNWGLTFAPHAYNFKLSWGDTVNSAAQSSPSVEDDTDGYQ